MACRQAGFPPASRLTKPAEFRNVFNSAVRSVDGQFVVLARKNGLGCARLGLAISKKALQRAVSRNKVKRLVRESFRHHRKQLAGFDIVVMVQKRIAITENKKMTESLSNHWNKLKK